MLSRTRPLLTSFVAFAVPLAFTACKGDKTQEEPVSPAAPVAKPTPAPTPPPKAPPEKPHGDHNARHDGVVMMAADMHFEAVLGADGKHAVYWSDGARDPLPASTLEKVALVITRPGESAENVALARDPKDEFWSGQGKPLADPPKADIAVRFNKPGVPSSDQKIVFSTAHDHDHGDHGAGPPVVIPPTLAEAGQQIEATQLELAAVVKDGDLAKAHMLADRLGKLGIALPQLATKAGLSPEDTKALTVAGKKLEVFFADMDAAGDAGKREEAQRVFARYAEPLATIKAKAK